MRTLLVFAASTFLWGCGSGNDSPGGGSGGSNATESGGASAGGAPVSTGSSSSVGGAAAAGGAATTSGGGLAASGGEFASGGAATSVGGTGGGLDPFVVRVMALCDAACQSIAEAPGCPDLGSDCSRDCTRDRTEALELGCSFEPVLDCADEHPDANRYFCDDNGIQAFDLESCAQLFDAYSACVLAAREES